MTGSRMMMLKLVVIISMTLLMVDVQAQESRSRSRNNYDTNRMTAGRRGQGDARRSLADEEPREPLTLKVRMKEEEEEKPC